MKGMRVFLATVSMCWVAVMLLVLDEWSTASATDKRLLTLLFILFLGSAALCYAHAGHLRRSRWGWAVAGLLLPFAAPWVLALCNSSGNMAKELERMEAAGDVDGLIDAIFDRNEKLALDAYVVLSKMDAKRTAPHLLRVLYRKSRMPGVHRRIISLLARSGEEDAIQALLAALGDRSFRHRADIVLELKEVDDPRACRAFLPLLTENDEDLRHVVIYALGELRCAEAASPLMELLRRGGSSDRSDAAAALGKMRCAEAVVPLLDALRDQREEVRSSAVEALGRLADERAVEPLLAMLEKECRQTRGKDPRWLPLRCSLVRALGELNDPRACQPLLACMSDPHPEVRDAAAEAYYTLRLTAQQQGLAVPPTEVVKCVGCGRWLCPSPLSGLEVLLNSAPHISATQVYPCKACGALFCLDCIAKAVVLGGSRQCPSCLKPSGW